MGKQKLIMLNDKSTILKLIFSVFIAFQLNCSTEQNSKFNVNYDLQGDYCISFTYINNNLEAIVNDSYYEYIRINLTDTSEKNYIEFSYWGDSTSITNENILTNLNNWNLNYVFNLRLNGGEIHKQGSGQFGDTYFNYYIYHNFAASLMLYHRGYRYLMLFYNFKSIDQIQSIVYSIRISEDNF